MTVSTTTRLGVYTWSAGTDEFTRDQMTDSHTALENRAAIFLQGTFAARPAAGASNARGFYLATDQGILYYSDGSAWSPVNSFATPVAIVPGDVNTAGSSSLAARADHKHGLPEWGVVGEVVQIGTTAAAGTTAKFARIDHRHTLGSNSVTAGTIASGAINNSNVFTNGVIKTAAIDDAQVTKGKLAVDQQIPAGSIMAFGGTSAPTGWLFCDGMSYAVNTYPDLAAALNGRYGGSATPGQNFNVPDLSDRFPRGGATTGAGVTTTGNDSVTIAAENLPNHVHSTGTLAVANHTDHVHTLTGTGSGASAANAAHTHPVQAVAGSGGLVNATVARFLGTSFLIFGGGNDPYQLLPPYWGGRPSDAGVYESGAAVANSAVNVIVNAHNTDNANANHSHPLTGQSAGSTTTLSHSISGNTGNPTGTVGQLLDVRPKSVTVNYIIKT